MFEVEACHCIDQPVPDHEEVESNEESEHPATVRHQRQERVGLLLPLNLDCVTWDTDQQFCTGYFCWLLDSGC